MQMLSLGLINLVKFNYQSVDHHCQEFKRDIENQIWKMLKALEIPCIFLCRET